MIKEKNEVFEKKGNAFSNLYFAIIVSIGFYVGFFGGIAVGLFSL